MENAKQIEAFLEFLRNAKVKHQAAIDEENATNQETQDILHRLELYSDNYHETAKLAKSLREVRQRRRAAKNTFEETRHIVRWSEDNKQVVKSLEWLLGELRKTELRQQTRSYVPKTNIVDEVLQQ